jgi:eukaryotic-like serine/threonine-protein kinase
MSSTQADRDRAQGQFEAWVAARGKQGELDAEAWIAEEPETVRAEFLAIVEDYLALAEGRSSDSGIGISSLPGAGTCLGDFRLVRELGRGGMGAVWEAEQISLGRRVALKLLHPLIGLSPTALARFQREAEVTARVRHANLVQVFSAGEVEGVPFIAQELIPDGHTLERQIRDENPDEALPSGHFRSLARRFAELAEALQHLHDQGILHRDVKPANVLVEGERLRLADFGLAQMRDEPALSRSGELLGTPAYMSPEQLAGNRQLGPPSDQFSLGATLYEVLTLQRAFPGDTREQIAHRIRNEDPIEPQRLRSKVPADLATICLKTLRKSRAERYSDAASLAVDLLRYANGSPIHAKPVSGARRLTLWLRRRPAVAAALVISVVSFAAVTGLAIYANSGWEKAETEAFAAERGRKTAEDIENFLVGVFGQMGPSGSLQPDSTGRELLDTAENALEDASELAASPLVRAALWVDFGALEAGLGQHEQAETMLRRGLALHEEQLAETDQRTLRAHNQLANLLVRRAKYDDAEVHYLAAQAGHDELYGADSAEALENQGNLAYLYWRVGRHEDAAPLLRNALKGSEARWGPDHFHTWSARNNLGALLIAGGDGVAAEPVLREVVAKRSEEGGPKTPPALAARSLLVQAVKQQDGREREAVQMYRELLADTVETFQADHPTTAGTQHSLGVLLAENGEPEEGAIWLEKAWRTRTRKLRAGHPSTQSSLRNLRTCWDLQRLDPDQLEANLLASIAQD